MKSVFIALLTVLFLPVAALMSFALIALTLAAVILFSPLLVLGGSIVSGSYLSEKITDWLFPTVPISIEEFRKLGNTPLFTSLGLTLLFIPLTVLPVAAFGVVVGALVTVLSIPILALSGAFWTAEQIVNLLSPEPVVEAPVEHSYHHLAPIEESLYQPSGKKPLEHAQEEEPSSCYSKGLRFFAPLLNCLRSFGGYANSADVEYTKRKGPSP
ncbi:hypothetical protein [Legionella feeleii]|uniref:Transmembrane protein n=1 Tax=Legionella feeleii TaxID=453 RepID=A0A0W0TMW5_9GAMM|nr:hypothetical protein [Legionella feeleii]KTC96921.1 hypothetical protein Lfee_1833 [Legionella feeleii]SPX60843.1 Uncharacterised protein [Legionella feeleii]